MTSPSDAGRRPPPEDNPPRASLPARLRSRPSPPRLLLGGLGFLGLLGALLVLGSIAEDIREQEAIALDALATPYLHALASPALDAFMRAATEAGSLPVVGLLFACAAGLLLRTRHRREALLLIAAMAGSVALNQGLKLVFHRPRPQLAWAQAPAEYSFPSGHAMNAVVFYLALSLIVWMIRGRRAGIAAACVAIVIAAAVGVSRIYLGDHYLSDVVAGSLAGGLWLLVVAVALDVRVRWRRPSARQRAQPRPPDQPGAEQGNRAR